MILGIFNNRAMRTLGGALDGLTGRQNAISSNIANAETPGYQRRTVPFEQQLQAQMGGAARMATTQPGHIAKTSTPRATLLNTPQGAEMLGTRNDANSVDIEQEMTDLAETTIRYYAVADVLKSKIETLRQVIDRA